MIEKPTEIEKLTGKLEVEPLELWLKKGLELYLGEPPKNSPFWKGLVEDYAKQLESKSMSSPIINPTSSVTQHFVAQGDEWVKDTKALKALESYTQKAEAKMQEQVQESYNAKMAAFYTEWDSMYPPSIFATQAQVDAYEKLCYKLHKEIVGQEPYIEYSSEYEKELDELDSEMEVGEPESSELITPEFAAEELQKLGYEIKPEVIDPNELFYDSYYVIATSSRAIELRKIVYVVPKHYVIGNGVNSKDKNKLWEFDDPIGLDSLKQEIALQNSLAVVAIYEEAKQRLIDGTLYKSNATKPSLDELNQVTLKYVAPIVKDMIWGNICYGIQSTE